MKLTPSLFYISMIHSQEDQFLYLCNFVWMKIDVLFVFFWHPLARFLLGIINNTYLRKHKQPLKTLITSSTRSRTWDKRKSFDVTNLFTNVLTEPSLTIVKNRPSADTTLLKGNNVIIDAIVELLVTCVNTTYFQVEDKFCKQEFGMAMGSPLSPILSNV